MMQIVPPFARYAATEHLTLLQIDGFQFSTLLQSGSSIQIYQGIRLKDGVPVVAKVLPDPVRHHQIAFHLQHELEQARSFSNLPTVKPVIAFLSNEKNSILYHMLPGQSLRQLMLKGRLEHLKVLRRLQLALQIAETLAQFHQANLLHFNLRPRHILINEQLSDIRLIDLTASVHIDAKLNIPPGIHQPMTRESDLLAPEQLGMIDRHVNGRADLFMLGCILFELFTGQSPFPTRGEPVLRLTHRPILMKTLNPQLPNTLYTIVSRLIQFDPDQRYQNIGQLIEDLGNCLAHQSITNAVPSQNTLFSNSAKVEETRSATKERLHHLLDRMLSGEHTWVTVSGPAGHDKSQLIRDLKGHVTSKGGLFIESACSPTHKLTPHGPLRSAIGTWINLLDNYYPHILEEMQRKTQKALGNNISLLEGIIPHWEKLTPKRKALIALPAQLARNRFKFVFREFITTFLNTPIPVVLVFDDMQWADDSSLELLNLIRHTVQPANLMVIAAYRGKRQYTNRFQNFNAEHFEISSFNENQIQNLLERYFPSSQLDLRPLAQLIHHTTQGTPYSVWRMLSKMEQDGDLKPATDRNDWHWDIAHLRNNLPRWQVKEWANYQVEQLPEATQKVMAYASLVGRKFTLQELAVLHSEDLTNLRDHLLNGLKTGLIQPRSYHFSRLPWMDNHSLEQHKSCLAFSFKNNLIHAALSEKLSSEGRACGYTALAQYYTSLQDQFVNATFWVADCYQYAVEMGADIDWLTRVVAMMRAGRLAKNRHALSSASHYYARAVDLCEDQHWDQHYELLYKLHLEALECAYLRQDENSAAWLHETLIEKVENPAERSEIFHKRSAFLRDRIRLEDALHSYLSALSELGIQLPLHDQEKQTALISEVDTRMQALDPQQIPRQPLMTDLKLTQAALILSEILPLSYFIGQNTFVLIVNFSLKLILDEGLSDAAPRVLGAYATQVLKTDPCRAYAIAKVAEHLDRNQVRATPDPGARGFLLIFVHHWFRNIHEVLRELDEEIHEASTIGDMDGFNYGVSSHYASCTAHGYSLNLLKQNKQNLEPLLGAFNLTFAASMVKIWGQLVHQLVDPQRKPWLLQVPGMMPLLDPDVTPRSQLEHNLRLQFHLAQVMLALIFRDVELALEHTEMAERHLTTAPRMPNVAKLMFYGTLAYIQGAKRFPDRTETYRPIIEEKFAILQTWAKHAPSNRNHELALIRAELAKPNEDVNQVIEQYDLAIETARQNHFTHDQALASELAAEFYLSRNREVIGRTYLNDARNLYQEWGATTKVKQLTQRALRMEQSGTAHAEMLEKLNRMNREIQNTQKQLMEQESMANLGNLTAGITHEIRNPLNFITNFAAVGVELLEDLRQVLNRYQKTMGEDFDEVMTMIDDLANNNAIIQKQGARAENIVRAMLRVSRNAKDKPRPTNLNQLLDEDINLAYHGQSKKNGFAVTIHREFSDQVGEVEMVARNISRVFLNLINNAFYALAERKQNSDDTYQPEIRVRTRREDDAVIIDFCDNGSGIEANILETVFTPFFTTKPTGEGTGIGLAMSKEIIEKEHSGKLLVTSQPNVSTTFTICLPLQQPSASNEEK